MSTPIAVIKAAKGYLKDFPAAKLVHLGKYGQAEAYYVKLPSDMKLGMPPVYLYQNAKVRPVYGEDALDIISSLS